MIEKQLELDFAMNMKVFQCNVSVCSQKPPKQEQKRCHLDKVGNCRKTSNESFMKPETKVIFSANHNARGQSDEPTIQLALGAGKRLRVSDSGVVVPGWLKMWRRKTFLANHSDTLYNYRVNHVPSLFLRLPIS